MFWEVAQTAAVGVDALILRLEGQQSGRDLGIVGLLCM